MLLFYKTTFKFCSFCLCLQAKFLKSYFTLIFITATPFASWKNTMLIHISSYCKTTSLICLLELLFMAQKIWKTWSENTQSYKPGVAGIIICNNPETKQVKAFNHKSKREFRINRICSFIWKHIFGLAGIALSKFVSNV